ncbi:General odorant-binding protein 2 [Eumeta japonica]|uniref:General odorant-binding protein 2 n=1 Tax=Eumeta variegata TaxID=151549 RepID=A0A4C1UID7_EUMVA|nr:General odorant-binding protein 2 [Eumeta japonica]
MAWWRALVVAAVVSAAARPSEGTAEVMSHVSVHFGKALQECREESGLTEEMMEEFHHFWREDFEVVHRELGCAIICMSTKLSLLDDNTRMHHDNMDEYVKSFPAGEVLSKRMVEMIHTCEKKYDDIADDCERVVKIAACFKADCQAAGIAPEMAMLEVVMEKY